MSVSDQGEKRDSIPSDEELDAKLKTRPRSATLLTLKWLADRLRRSDAIKEKLKNGKYDVDSEKIAKALANQE